MSAIINDTVKLYSGNGRQFLGLDELCKALANKACCVLDGELIVVDENDHILPRKIGNGILNKSIKGTITNKESAQVRFIVWDIISIDCFFNKNNSKSSKYQFRLQELYGIVNKINSKLCTHVKSKLVNSLSEAAEDFRKQTAFGEEGTILKSVDNIWSSTRASDQIKFKEVFPCEMKITGIYLGKPNSKYKNCIGGFNIESRCGKVKCNVGSGLTDTDRGFNLNEEEFKVLTQKYLNSIISIEYNARIHSENKTEESLFLPRVIDFRLDKNEADTLETMKNQEKSTRELGELK